MTPPFGEAPFLDFTSDGRWAYTWDAENRLIAIETLPNLPTNVPVQKLLFQYDAQSRRISKVVSNFNGSTWSEISNLKFVYDQWNLLSELSVVSNQFSVVRSYAWGLDLSGSPTGAGGIAGLLFGTFNGSSSTSSVAYAYDGNGNVSALLDMRTGQLAAEYEYSPFGETIRATGPLAKENPFRFSTKRTDDTTGLILYEYRILNPVTGRWLSRDPMGERGSQLLYAFVNNNPVAFADDSGLKPVGTISNTGGISFGDPSSSKPDFRGSLRARINAIGADFEGSAIGRFSNMRVLIKKLLLALDNTQSIDGNEHPGAIGTYDDGTLSIPPSATDDTLVHELVHAYNDKVESGLTLPDNEGMAYTTMYMFQTARSMLTLEKRLTGCPCDELYNKLAPYWNGWDFVNPDVMFISWANWNSFLPRVEGKADKGDVARVYKRLGFRLSCDKLSAVYNGALQVTDVANVFGANLCPRRNE